MKALNPNTIAIVTTLSAISSLAQSSELTLTQDAAASSDPMLQPITYLVYRHAATKNLTPAELYGGKVLVMGDSAKALFEAARINTNALSLTIPHTNILRGDDHASFSIYAPMKTVNGALSLAGYACDSRVDDSKVKLVQVLSALARRKVNAEFSYTLKPDSRSNFSTAVGYSMSQDPGLAKSGVVLNIRYSVKF